MDIIFLISFLELTKDFQLDLYRGYLQTNQEQVSSCLCTIVL